jgi:hypothetical protein
LRGGPAANACRTVQGRAKAALAPAPYFRKDRLVIVMTIYLLLCKCPADSKAIDEVECARNGTQWLCIFTEDFSRNFVFHETDGVCDYGELDAATANGKLYASWSDAHRVFFSTSSDQGSHWSYRLPSDLAGGWLGS